MSTYSTYLYTLIRELQRMESEIGDWISGKTTRDEHEYLPKLQIEIIRIKDEDLVFLCSKAKREERSHFNNVSSHLNNACEQVSSLIKSINSINFNVKLTSIRDYVSNARLAIESLKKSMRPDRLHEELS